MANHIDKWVDAPWETCFRFLVRVEGTKGVYYTSFKNIEMANNFTEILKAHCEKFEMIDTTTKNKKGATA